MAKADIIENTTVGNTVFGDLDTLGWVVIKVSFPKDDDEDRFSRELCHAIFIDKHDWHSITSKVIKKKPQKRKTRS